MLSMEWFDINSYSPGICMIKIFQEIIFYQYFLAYVLVYGIDLELIPLISNQLYFR